MFALLSLGRVLRNMILARLQIHCRKCLCLPLISEPLFRVFVKNYYRSNPSSVYRLECFGEIYSRAL